MLVLCLTFLDFATCSLALLKHVVSVVACTLVPMFLRFFISFLFKRTQSVFYKNQVSGVSPINLGAPQGSVPVAYFSNFTMSKLRNPTPKEANFYGFPDDHTPYLAGKVENGSIYDNPILVLEDIIGTKHFLIIANRTKLLFSRNDQRFRTIQHSTYPLHKLNK